MNTKTCLPCTNFDYVKRVCLDGTPAQPTNVPTNPTMPSTPAVQPVQRMTNLQNPSGILLPSDKSLPEYTK